MSNEHGSPSGRLRSRTRAQIFLVGAYRHRAALPCEDSGTGDGARAVRRGSAPRNGAWAATLGGGNAQCRAWLDQRTVVGVLARALDARDRPADTWGASAEIVRLIAMVRVA